MLEDGRITYKQLILLIIISRLIITITYLPALNSPPENQDIWIAEAFSFPFLLLFAVPAYLLAQRFSKHSIVQCAEVLLGKAGKLVGMLYVWFFLHLTAITLRQFGEFLTSVPYPETPILTFIIATALISAYAVRNGIEVISRNGEIIGPIILTAIVLIVILVAKEMKLQALTPVFEKGVMPVLHGGFTITARTVEVLVVAMLLPYLNRPKKAKKAIILSFFMFCLFFIIITIPVQTILGVELAKSNSFPFFGIVRLINIGQFFERIDAIHIGIWVLGVFLKVSIYYYLTVLGAAQLFNLQDYRPLVLPMGTIAVGLSILQADSLIALREFTSYKIFTWYALFFTVALPLLLLIVAFIRGKGVISK